MVTWVGMKTLNFSAARILAELAEKLLDDHIEEDCSGPPPNIGMAVTGFTILLAHD